MHATSYKIKGKEFALIFSARPLRCKDEPESRSHQPSHLLCHQPGPSPAHPWPMADRREQTRAHTHKPCAHFLNETPHVGNKYCIVSLSLSLPPGRRSLYIKRHQTVVLQLCLQVLSHLSGQNAEDPSIQVFFCCLLAA